jgi:hypothetical protein
MIDGTQSARMPGQATIHRAELLENWTQLASSGTFKRVEPLV